MRAHVLLVAALAQVGCSCAGSAPVDAGLDAFAPPDIPSDDVPTDLGADAPRADVPLRAPICGDVLASSCPTQSTATVSACGAAGLVYFDGAHCQETPRDDCASTDRGAFGSFEECAVVCEAAGECDASKIVFGPSEHHPGCRVSEPVPTECSAGALGYTAVDLSEHVCLFDYEFRCSPWFTGFTCECYRPGPPPPVEDLFLRFRRLSLLPFVDRLECTPPL